MEKPRCFWCHSYHDIMYEKMIPVINRLGIPKGEEDEFFCSEDCFQKADQFLKRCARFSIPSLVILAIVLAAIFNSFWFSAALNIRHTYFLALAILPVGILLEIVPFSTPETILYMGLKKGARLTRFIGLFLIMISAALFFMGS
jgi:hypothetical protein